MSNRKVENIQEETIHLDNGLELRVKSSIRNDMELFDDLLAIDEGEVFALNRALKRMMTPEEKAKLYNSLREDGVTPVSAVVLAMKEIFDKLGDAGKN